MKKKKKDAEEEKDTELRKLQCLTQDKPNSVSMKNPYLFNNIKYDKNKNIGVNKGVYTITGVTKAHPIGFVINDINKFEVISGNIYGTKTVENKKIKHYTGTIKF
jgi:hypothetical protein